MCGVGLLYSPNKSSVEAQGIIKSMQSSLSHRGPDSQGEWSNDGMHLFHTRLAIIDLSPEGHQPMLSKDKSWVISYNGEIYNYQILRKELESKGHSFRGHSDTEVLVELIATFGVQAALKRLRGMFSIIAYHIPTQSLYLAIDRFGEKPLYYGWVGEDFVAASELKAFKKLPNWKPEISNEAFSYYLKYNYIPQPMSIFKGINKAEPARLLQINLKDKKLVASEHYWQLQSVQNDSISFNEALNLTENKLIEVIKNQMVSDVPLGSFLSGGIDSSVVTALMQKISSRPVNTFTIGFHEKDFDESVFAQKISEALGTHHTNWILKPSDLLSCIEDLPTVYDEPFADSSQIPTLLLSRLTRKHVTVSLSGDGGDELFAGYTRYLYARKLASINGLFPESIRKALAGLGKGLPESLFNVLYNVAITFRPGVTGFSHPYQKYQKALECFSASSDSELYDSLLSQWKDPSFLLAEFPSKPAMLFNNKRITSLNQFMMTMDKRYYLPGDIFTKVDRAAMSTSLETRAPFLDHELQELVGTFPLDFNIRNAEGKFLLKQIAYKYIPKELLDRPKMGFGVPIGKWIRSDLKEMAADLLSENYIKNQGLLNPYAVNKVLTDHLSNKRNYQYQLWNLLMFQLWYRKWM